MALHHARLRLAIKVKSRDIVGALNIGQQPISRQPCCQGNTLQYFCGSRVNAVHKIANRRLTHTHSLCESRLSRLRSFQVIAKRFHMETEGIGFAYDSAIGQSYLGISQNWPMAKTVERSFLDRALEALGERYPREKPTQTKLAKLAGVSQPSVYEWGEPDRVPAMPTGVKLAKQLGVCVEWLYTERGSKRPIDATSPDEHLSPILEVWPNLGAEIKRQIARYTDFIKDDK